MSQIHAGPTRNAVFDLRRSLRPVTLQTPGICSSCNLNERLEACGAHKTHRHEAPGTWLQSVTSSAAQAALCDWHSLVWNAHMSQASCKFNRALLSLSGRDLSSVGRNSTCARPVLVSPGETTFVAVALPNVMTWHCQYNKNTVSLRPSFRKASKLSGMSLCATSTRAALAFGMSVGETLSSALRLSALSAAGSSTRVKRNKRLWVASRLL